MRTVSIIQARSSSSRLPGKVLREIAGKPMLWHVVRRARRAQIGDVVLATSVDKSDDPVAEFCASDGIPCFRGSLTDVLDRYYQAAKAHRADIVVRLTGDCPLLDPGVIRRVVDLYGGGGYDYVSNCDPPTFPDGLDTEVFSFQALERSWKEAVLPSEREHVTPYCTKHPELFRSANVTQADDLSSLRWTVDEERDLEFVRTVFALLHTLDFGMKEVLSLIRADPRLQGINAGIIRNAGHASAFRADEEFLRHG